MRKIVYTKYNSLRKPEFRTMTSICIEEGEKYVTKRALNPESVMHLNRMHSSYEKYADYYNDISLIACEKAVGEVRFPFVSGGSLLESIDFEKDNISDILQIISGKLQIIFDVNEKYRTKFALTEAFNKIFPDCEPRCEEAFRVSNFDSIFPNFICENDKVCCLDYEWLLPVCMPVEYIRYRTVLYVYKEYHAFLKDKIQERDFLLGLGIHEANLELWEKMEYLFQQYVHGENVKYIYLERYKKSVITIPELQKQITDKSTHIQNIESLVESERKINHELNMQLQERERELEEIRAAEKSLRYLGRAMKITTKEKLKRFIPNFLLTKRREWKNKKCFQGNLQLEQAIYEKWIKRLEEENDETEKFEYNPKISILVPVYNVLDRHLIPCIESVLGQTYENWELCLVDDCSTWDNVRKTLESYRNNEKIKVQYRAENGHISKCTNTALDMATGEYIAFLDCDDVLAKNALYEVVKVLNEDKRLDFIYSDEDKIDDQGDHRHSPFFKPDWSPDTIMSLMYTCHFSVYRRSIAVEIGGLREGYEGAQDYDFVLRFTEKTNHIAHISKILYHWRQREESTAGNPEAKPYIMDVSKRLKQDAMKRRNIQAEIELVDTQYQYRVNYLPAEDAKVSIIIPSKDNFKIFKRCIESLVTKTQYKNYEIILVDNGSEEKNHQMYAELCQKYNIRYIYNPMPFNFSAMCNIGAKAADGKYYLFLNDDIEVIEGTWLERMTGQAQQVHVGAVGAKLFYPNSDRIQHAGVINIISGPVHCFGNYEDKTSYYYGRNKLDYNFLAVTGACLLVAAEKYWQVDGFREELAVAYNDVDLCFKLYEAGYYNVLRNDAVLYHHESISRGDDAKSKEKFERLMREQDKLYELHPTLNRIDPFYNKHLAQNRADFSFNYEEGKNEKCSIREENVNITESKKIAGNIDSLKLSPYFTLEGWVILSGEDNEDLPVEIVLKNGRKCYILTTQKRYRSDVANALKNEKNIEFAGVFCSIPNAQIMEGTYDIYVKVNHLMRKLDECVIAH